MSSQVTVESFNRAGKPERVTKITIPCGTTIQQVYTALQVAEDCRYRSTTPVVLIFKHDDDLPF